MLLQTALARTFKLVLVISLIIQSAIAFAQRDAISFERISVEQGLSQNTVYAILQDHKGFYWFGTEDGLNRYDGINFKVFTHRANDSLSLSNSRVIAIIEDSKRRLWVGTIGGGLNLFDWDSETFVSYVNEPTNEHSLSNNRVMALLEDPSGKIWVGTADGGLNLFDPETGRFRVYKNSVANSNLLPSNIIRSLFIDSNGLLWIGTDNGIATYNPTTDSFDGFTVRNPDGTAYSTSIIRRFFEDSTGKIWIATDEEGLISYCTKGEEFSIYRHNPHRQNTLPSNTVHDVYEDDKGCIWIATYGGLSKFIPESNTFTNYQNCLYNSESLSSNLIRTLYEDRLGILWLGTNNNGVNKFDRKSKRFTVYRNLPSNAFSVPTTSVSSILEDNEGVIWIGTYGEGLIQLDIQSEVFQYHRASSHSGYHLPNNYVTSIAQDQHGYLWVGTNNGLAKYSKQTNRFNTVGYDLLLHNQLPENRIKNIYVDSENVVWVATLNRGISRLLPDERSFQSFAFNPDDSTTISQNRITSLFEDSYGNFWIATSHEGLNLFDREKGRVVQVYRKDATNPSSIASDRVLYFFQDSKDRLWLGTNEGLSLFNYSDKTFKNYTILDGLPSNVIYGIEEDSNGRLWMSTNKGLSCLDYSNPSEPDFRNYDKYDGLPLNEFSHNASCRLGSGDILFGGINNLIAFNPLEIHDDTIPPLVYVNEVRVSQYEQDGQQSSDELVINLLHKDSLEFNFSQNNLSFYITVIHPRSPQKNRFKYMLEGFDSKWIEPTIAQQFVRYTNLKPGKYTFKVIASNSDGLWNEQGDSVHFKIRKPFWNRWWFYVLVSSIFLAIAYLLARFRDNRLMHSKAQLEDMVNERTQELFTKSQELLIQSERLQQANEEIRATSEALGEQNELLTKKNEEITLKNLELEEQKNSLANLAWELQDKNEEITAQRNEIERQKKEITDSIFYAHRIQQAVLPSQDQIKELFTEFFIFNRPKSIVSGDFYWATRIGRHRVVAVVDCTGHGVPGGFMSMLGVLMLNEVISLRGIVDPAKALNQLRQGIISVLHQKGDFSDAADGMDLSLCVIDDEDKTLTYSGANSSMVVFEPNAKPGDEIVVLRSDRMPIAYHPLMKSFTNQVVPLTSETLIFLYSDGIIDQFGGPKNKKFQHHRLVDFIIYNKDLPLETQGIVIEQTFDKWKGKTYQVDDVLVMGLRV